MSNETSSTTKIHKLAKLFPRMSDEEYENLKASIADHGLLEPIVLMDGEIIDGRHRYEACCDVGLEPNFEEFDLNVDPLVYVLDKNLNRRHLSTSQRAAVTTEMANMKSGRRTDTKPGANLREVSIEEAAKIMGVSPRLVDSAKKVQREDPDLFEEIKEGKVTVNAAVRKLDNKEKDGPKTEKEEKSPKTEEEKHQEPVIDIEQIRVEIRAELRAEVRAEMEIEMMKEKRSHLGRIPAAERKQLKEAARHRFTLQSALEFISDHFKNPINQSTGEPWKYNDVVEGLSSALSQLIDATEAYYDTDETMAEKFIAKAIDDRDINGEAIREMGKLLEWGSDEVKATGVAGRRNMLLHLMLISAMVDYSINYHWIADLVTKIEDVEMRDPENRRWHSNSPLVVFGLKPWTNLDEIKATYRLLAKRWHPDREAGNTAVMANVAAAYDQLKQQHRY